MMSESRASLVCQYFCSTIGKKLLVALTGLGMAGFLVTHLAGNLLIFVGAEAYNRYSHNLVTNPLLPVAEIGLVLLFLVHVGLTLSLFFTNRASKSTGYEKSAVGTKTSGFAAKTMILTGLVTLAFIVLHLITFKYGPHYTVNYGGTEMRDIYRLIVEKFQQPLYIGWYVVALIVLGFHLSHGVKGAFQSLGIASSFNPKLKRGALAFAILMAGGFMAQPIYVFICGGR